MTVGFTPVGDDLYREIILDHFRRPRHRGEVSPADGTVDADNPLCGDELHLGWRLDGDRIAEIAFAGKGCSISQAAASMLCEAVAGAERSPAITLLRRYHAMLVAGGGTDDLGDLEALQGVAAYPMRIKCATLAANAMLQALGATTEESDGHE
ncbi:MAG: Fe-S cluster assembly sulfur transfer protein SufU [Candidatus Dormibacteria bacterium]